MVVKYDMLPAHMQDGARQYIEEGVMPGSFLLAVLQNNLVNAFGNADEMNITALQVWATWLHWSIPSAAWGSPEKVGAWIESHREERANA